MARRLRTGSHEQLSTQELAALRKQLSGMPPHEIEIYYKASYAACQYNVHLPSPRLIQELSRRGGNCGSERYWNPKSRTTPRVMLKFRCPLPRRFARM